MSSNVRQEQLLIEKIRALPAEKAAAVQDFVDFLFQRDEDRQLTRAAVKLSAESFHKVWDNADDDVYNEL